ncbi:MAG: energy transducer TonB [Pseudohaliea sp.]
MEAARKEINGFCTLQFDVAENGDVENPQVLACCPEGYFEKPSIEALSRFRYQSSSYRVTGVVEVFWFSAEINSEYSHWKNLGFYNRVECRGAVQECHAILAAP